MQLVMTRTPNQNSEEREILEQAAKIEAIRRAEAAHRPPPQRTRTNPARPKLPVRVFSFWCGGESIYMMGCIWTGQYLTRQRHIL
jgi:hypothetical protein